MLARLASYSAVLSFVCSLLMEVATFKFTFFVSNMILNWFCFVILIFLSRIPVFKLSRYEWFNNWFFGEDFDFQAAYEGRLDAYGRNGKTHDMTIHYKQNQEFHINIGESNDYLYKIGARPRMGQIIVALNLADSCQNYMIAGGIGSGKTVCAISPILYQLLDQANTNEGEAAGGYIMDIKGDFKGSVYDLAGRHGRSDITTIGVNEGQAKINIIGGLSPQIAAAFLKASYEQTEEGTRGVDPFWMNSAIETIKNGLTILHRVEMYTLNNLYHLTFDKEFEATVLKAATELSTGDLELIAAINYYKDVYLANEKPTLQSIKSTIGTLISAFATNPQMVATFCNTEAANANTLFTDIIEKGKIVLLDLPVAIHGLVAKIVYVLLKLRFMNLVQIRPSTPNMNQKRPVFFMCDEYQNAITSKSGFLSDSSFWDKSRSAKCIGVISFQTISSVVSALGGDRATAESILANFRNRIFFANEDPQTIDYIQRVAGKYEKVRKTVSTGESSQGFFSKTTQNSGISTTIVETQIVGAEDIRTLGQGYTFSMLRVNNTSFVDILKMHYVPTEASTPAPKPKLQFQ
jgi:hypothetical protein